ncbi:D-xylose ABC transporter substrate-binding protein [Rhodovibrio salinarum]|uniref:D-xylose ABC transporter substrate-binding protein n=2 Tax=Rhodovibrio salinarum TaxID=1087 RepID=A0A934QIG3_9PROT|nr:D-xylose ABC transporter substrate-binding protein [Rhodovibrio salinarum]
MAVAGGLLALFVGALTVLAPQPVAAQDDLTIGVSWSNFQEERWKRDENAMKQAIEAAGATYISTDAQSQSSKQLTDVENLIARGADALIILAWDSDAIIPAVQSARNQGIPVVGYDRLIEHPEAFYISYDNREVGRQQALAVLNVQPTGNYVFIKGAQTDPNADILHKGQMDVMGELIETGKIKVVGEQYTDGWAPSVAQENMEQILTRTNNEVDAVVASNDGTAGGAISALASQGMAGSVPVSGQDADHAALNRIARGTQTISVFKDARELGRQAAEVAIKLAKGTALSEIPDTRQWSNGPREVEMTARLLKPIPVTRANLDIVLHADWIDKETLCRGVESDEVAACN